MRCHGMSFCLNLRRFSIAGLVWLWAVSSGRAQGGFASGFDVLHTGGGQPLVTTVRTGAVAIATTDVLLQFDFGFDTDETASPGPFFDSITATLQSAVNPTVALVLLTADASGVNWAPASPGALPLAPDTIARTPITPPSLQPVLASRLAFVVIVPVPAGLQGQPLNFYFDLFDNQNAVASRAWLGDISVIPEPAVVSLLVVGLGVWRTLRRLRP